MIEELYLFFNLCGTSGMYFFYWVPASAGICFYILGSLFRGNDGWERYVTAPYFNQAV